MIYGHGLLKMGKSVIIITMRAPGDMSAFHQTGSKTLFGSGGMKGRLPVSISKLKKAG
jgi:hypothetical protein